MAKKSAVRVTPSTGNVFRDLGFAAAEAEHLLVRADLLIQVQKLIASRGISSVGYHTNPITGWHVRPDGTVIYHADPWTTT